MVRAASALLHNSKGNSHGGGYTGVRKFAIFDGNRRLPRKRYDETGPWPMDMDQQYEVAGSRSIRFSVITPVPFNRERPNFAW